MIIDFICLLIIFLLFVFLLKSDLYWLYVGQNYEYRPDRIKTYLRSRRFLFDLKDVYNPLALTVVRRPKPTLKSLLVLFALFCLQILGLSRFLKPLAIFFNIRQSFFLSLALDFFVLSVLVLPFVFGLIFMINLPSILIKTLIEALAKNKIKKMKDLAVIGISGSYGKSSSKEILAHLLSAKYRVLKTEGSINTKIGVAKTILKNLKPNTEIFIVEMGAYKKGEIREICRIARPKIAMITGINQQHLELFGGIDAIREAKYELIQALPDDGAAFFNLKDTNVFPIYEKTKTRKIAYRQPSKRINSSLEADFMQVNLEGAIKVARYLKVEPKVINKQLKSLPTSRHFIRRHKGFGQSTLWDNSYNTNPSSFEASLSMLRKNNKSKNIIITPGIIELGIAGDKVHRRLAKQISKLASTLILSNPNFYEIFRKELDKDVKLLVAEPKTDLTKLIDKKTVILLEGRIPGWLYKKVLARHI